MQTANRTIANLFYESNIAALISKAFPEELIKRDTSDDCDFVCLFSDMEQDTRWLWMPSDEKTDASVAHNYTDNLIDSIFSTLAFESDFGAQLSFFATQDLDHQHQQNTKLIFRPDSLMLAASSANYGLFFILVSSLVLFGFLYYSIKHLITQRLLGEHIPDHFRVMRPHDNPISLKQRQPCLSRLKDPTHAKPVLLLNANPRQAKACLDTLDIQIFEQEIKAIDGIVAADDGIETFLASIKKAIASKTNPSPIVVALSGVEQASINTLTRGRALRLLSDIISHEKVRVLLIANTAPLFRLLRPDSYQRPPAEEAKLSEDEILGWTALFAEFDKEYLWLPTQKKRLANPVDLDKLLAHESKAWYALAGVKQKFLEYHKSVKQRSQHDSLSKYWMPEQIIEFFLVQAGPLYRQQWELCTIDEKLALWHLSHGANINPANTQVLEHLVRRGFIYRDKGWHIINESFRRFVLSAEDESTISSWIEDSATGIWPIIRIPIFAVFIVLVVVLYYSSGDSFTSIIGVATATLGLIPLILKNLNLVRGDSLPEMN